MILLLRLVVINLTLLWLNLLVVGSDEIVDPDRTNLICELLNSTVTYSQEKAPLDISKLVSEKNCLIRYLDISYYFIP